MKKNLLFIIILFLSFEIFSGTNFEQHKDSLRVEMKLYELEHKIKIIDQNQLNYKIEKEILKETYENSYKNINLVITIVLGIIGVLGYLGIRDISSIKKEYLVELESLKDIEREFQTKSKEFEKEKYKFDTEIKQIIEENKEQNKKIKIIELKEKINQLIKDKKYSDALSYINATLDLSPKDAQVLNNKGRVNCRLNRLDESLEAFKLALENEDNVEGNKTILINIIELLFFSNKIEEADKLISENLDIVKEKGDGELENFFEIFRIYHSGDESALIEKAKSYINFNDLTSMRKKMKRWDLEEAKYIAAHQSQTKSTIILQNILWFLDGLINGETVCRNLGIKLDNE